jgi:hypothetical protein
MLYLADFRGAIDPLGVSPRSLTRTGLFGSGWKPLHAPLAWGTCFTMVFVVDREVFGFNAGLKRSSEFGRLGLRDGRPGF